MTTYTTVENVTSYAKSIAVREYISEYNAEICDSDEELYDYLMQQEECPEDVYLWERHEEYNFKETLSCMENLHDSILSLFTQE